MNKVDHIILEELAKNARVPFSKIAKKIGVSTQTIIKRYNAMKKNGTIEYCSIKVDLHAIGYRGSAGLLLTGKSESNMSKVVEKLSKRKNIIGATRTFGDYEGYAILVFKDLKELYADLIEIKKIPDLLKVDFSLTLIGHHYFPPGENMNFFKDLENK